MMTIWFENDQPFSPQMATSLGDLTTVHSWIFGQVGPRLGARAPQLVWFCPACCELAAAWTRTRAWSSFKEIGAPENFVDPEAPQFLTDTVDILMGEQAGGVSPGLEESPGGAHDVSVSFRISRHSSIPWDCWDGWQSKTHWRGLPSCCSALGGCAGSR